MSIEQFELCIKPDVDKVIWRYMNLEKFESILRDNALFFCRVDRFADPFEGSIPKHEADYRIQEHRTISYYYGNEFDPIKAQQNIDLISNLHRKFKMQHVINCWHLNNSENDSMWRLYLDSNEGIAIKTTVAKLKNSFVETEEEINISKVRYLDYEVENWYDEVQYPIKSYNMFIPLVHKRIEFKQEEEVRLIHSIKTECELNEYWKAQPNPIGKKIAVNVANLVDSIYTPPTCDESQIEKVKKIVEKYNFNFKILKSGLSIEPYY
jgi:hypothetical protein